MTRTFRHLAYLACLLMIENCKSSSESGAVTSDLAPDQLALLQQGPGEVDLHAANRLVPPGANQVIELRLADLAQSGLAQRILASLPTAWRQRYERFVVDSGLDPIATLDGLLVWSNAAEPDELAAPGSGASLVVVARRGVVADLLRYLLRTASESRDSTRQAFTAVLIAPMSQDEVDVVISMALADPTNSASQRIGPSSALVSYQHEEGNGYAYIWRGGIAIEYGDMSSDRTLAAAAEGAYRLVRRLGDAAKSNSLSPRGEQAISMHITQAGNIIEISLLARDPLVLDVTLPGRMVGSAEEVATKWPMVAALPDSQIEQLLNQAGTPEPWMPLAKRVLRTVQLQNAGTNLKARVAMPQEEVLGLIPRM